MRQLQYGKLCELVETLQEDAVILSDMSDSGARAGLVSDMEFFQIRLCSMQKASQGQNILRRH